MITTRYATLNTTLTTVGRMDLLAAREEGCGDVRRSPLLLYVKKVMVTWIRLVAVEIKRRWTLEILGE